MKTLKRFSFLLACLAFSACERKQPLPVFGQVPAFELTASDGSSFQSTSLNSKIWIADFIFTTCPGPCPRMSSQMKLVAKELAAARDIAIVSFTVDPEHDTPAVLAEYARRYAADTMRWHFLTGPIAKLDQLAWDSFHLNHVDGKLEHSTRFAVVDSKGRIRAYIGTEDQDPVKAALEVVSRLRQES